MEIIIGRDEQQQCLQLTINKRPQAVPSQHVPLSVSRQHCMLQMEADGKLLLKNLNPRNVTRVNGLSVERRQVSKSDIIELGLDHYVLPWNIIESFLPEEVSIAHLPMLYQRYLQEQMAQSKRSGREAAIYSVGGVISMLGMLLMMLLDDKTIRICSLGLSLTVAIGLMIYRFGTAGKQTEKSRRSREEFERRYVCPKCGYPLKNISPQQLQFLNACPHCKVVYTRKNSKRNHFVT